MVLWVFQGIPKGHWFNLKWGVPFRGPVMDTLMYTHNMDGRQYHSVHLPYAGQLHMAIASYTLASESAAVRMFVCTSW